MADLLDVLRIVTSRLELSGVPYMVSGSLALGYYAQPRMTRDIDVVVELDHEGIQRLVAAFAADFYTLPGKSRDYFGAPFTRDFARFTKPVFTRNLAVRR